MMPAGQEALVRRMVSPSLPPGWRFARADIRGDGIEARYRHDEGARAEVRLSRREPDDRGLVTARFAVRVQASAGAAFVSALVASVLASVRALEPELRWAAAAPVERPPVAGPAPIVPPPPPPEGDPADAQDWSPRHAPESPADAPTGDIADSPQWLPRPPATRDPRTLLSFLGPLGVGLDDALAADLRAPPTAPALPSLLDALDHASGGRRDEARRALSAAASAGPGSLAVTLTAALAHFCQQAPERAVEALDGLLDRAPSPDAALAAWCMRYEVQRRMGWFHEARETLDAAVERFPSHAPLRMAGAALLAELHDEAGAAAWARAAVDLSDSDELRLSAARALQSAGREADAKALLDAVTSRDGGPPPGVLLDAASLAGALGLYDRATALYEGALAASSDGQAAREALATLCAWRGDAAGAADHAGVVLRSRPESGAARVARGAAALLMGDAAGALRDFDVAVRACPRDPEAVIGRAEALMLLGSLDEAHHEAARGCELSDDGASYVAGQLVRGVVRSRQGAPLGSPDRPLREAVTALLAQSVEDVSGDDDALFARGLAALRGNRSWTPTVVRPDGSLARVPVAPSPRLRSKRALLRFVSTADAEDGAREFAAIRAAFPGAAEPSNYEGEMYLYLGEYALARRCFERALATYERSRWAFIGLMAVAVLEGRCEEALAVLERGVALSGPPGPTAFVYRGEARRRLGHRVEARRDLEHAVKMSPSRVGAWVDLGLLQRSEGDSEGLARTMEALGRIAPGFVADATSPETGDDGARVLEAMLVMLRGNRASSCVTYFTRGGRLRTALTDATIPDAGALLGRVRVELASAAPLPPRAGS